MNNTKEAIMQQTIRQSILRLGAYIIFSTTLESSISHA